MISIKYFSDDFDVQNKKSDSKIRFKCAIKKKEIQDKTRILLNLPFLEILIKKKAKIIIISHLGRPKGVDRNLSLAPIYKFLKKN